MRQWTGSSLIQVLACRPFSTNPIKKGNAHLLAIEINWSELSVMGMYFNVTSPKCPPIFQTSMGPRHNSLTEMVFGIIVDYSKLTAYTDLQATYFL